MKFLICRNLLIKQSLCNWLKIFNATELDPACRSSRDGSGDVCQGGDMPQVSTQGYMPLLIHQENLKPAKSNYMKMGDDASETS